MRDVFTAILRIRGIVEFTMGALASLSEMYEGVARRRARE